MEVESSKPVQDMDIENENTESGEKLPKAVPLSLEILQNLMFVKRGVELKESRLLSRALRHIPSIRKKLKSCVVEGVVNDMNHASVHSEVEKGYTERMRALLSCCDVVSRTEGEVDMEDDMLSLGRERIGVVHPEMEMYLMILTITLAIDAEQYDSAVSVSKTAVDLLAKYNRRTMDMLGAKIHFYYAFAHELRGGDSEVIRHVLHAAYRTACLRLDDVGQATCLNLLLRSYILTHQIDVAHKLLSKTVFPTTRATAQVARYLYYTGRIQTIQLEYTEAHASLMQASHKAPQSTALGFRLAIHKLMLVVTLLMGDIPMKSAFAVEGMKQYLLPYLDLAQTVRVGDLPAFLAVTAQHEQTFERDGNARLIARLRQNVIKTGLRKINVSYSRISLEDIATKLSLTSVEDAESVVMKAIRDGVMEASIDHAAGEVKMKSLGDVYATSEPSAAFHKRIEFCLQIHNDCIRAMRFPDNAHADELEAARLTMVRQKTEPDLEDLAGSDSSDGPVF